MGDCTHRGLSLSNSVYFNSVVRPFYPMGPRASRSQHEEVRPHPNFELATPSVEPEAAEEALIRLDGIAIAPVRMARDPGAPKAGEKEEDCLPHSPCRIWCPTCVKARGREDDHLRVKKPKRPRDGSCNLNRSPSVKNADGMTRSQHFWQEIFRRE